MDYEQITTERRDDGVTIVTSPIVPATFWRSASGIVPGSQRAARSKSAR